MSDVSVIVKALNEIRDELKNISEKLDGKSTNININTEGGEEFFNIINKEMVKRGI